jgi:hypothetical protein
MTTKATVIVSFTSAPIILASMIAMANTEGGWIKARLISEEDVELEAEAGVEHIEVIGHDMSGFVPGDRFCWTFKIHARDLGRLSKAVESRFRRVPRDIDREGP